MYENRSCCFISFLNLVFFFFFLSFKRQVIIRKRESQGKLQFSRFLLPPSKLVNSSYSLQQQVEKFFCQFYIYYIFVQVISYLNGKRIKEEEEEEG